MTNDMENCAPLPTDEVSYKEMKLLRQDKTKFIDKK